MRDGPEEGLKIIDAITAHGELDDYYLTHAARGDLYKRLGRVSDAVAAYRRTLELVTQEPERRFVIRRLRELGDTRLPES
jgi:RNA polymerase sigma-70 factor, ECF subfamily